MSQRARDTPADTPLQAGGGNGFPNRPFLERRRSFGVRRTSAGDWIGVVVFLLPMLGCMGILLLLVLENGTLREALVVGGFWLVMVVAAFHAFLSGRTTLGADGIAMNARGKPRFVPWSAIDRVAVDIPLSQRAGIVILRRGDRPVALARVPEARELVAEATRRLAAYRGVPETLVPVTLREHREDGYRNAALPVELLRAIAADPRVETPTRVRALAALRRQGVASELAAIRGATARRVTRVALRD